jgi:hypothetical protein
MSTARDEILRALGRIAIKEAKSAVVNRAYEQLTGGPGSMLEAVAARLYVSENPTGRWSALDVPGRAIWTHRARTAVGAIRDLLTGGGEPVL